MQYQIWLPGIDGYVHNQCFIDQAVPLQAALRELGHEAPISNMPDPTRRNIVLGGHLLQAIPECDCVIWNLEQVQEDSPWFTPGYLALLRAKPVWDYSVRNVEELARLGIEARLLPVGYHTCMRSIVQAEPPEYDVLHYGSMNDRRKVVLEQLSDRGVKVAHAFGVYGKERDALIAKSKLVLNISYYESKIFNITRCSTLFANSVPVVSETGPGSEAFHETGGFVEYDGLVGRCVALLSSGSAEVGARGFNIFSQQFQAAYLEAVL